MAFDNLSKSMLVIWLPLVALIATIALLCSGSASDLDSRFLIIFSMWTVVGLGMCIWLGRCDRSVRIVGMSFQMAALAIGIYVLADVRNTLHQPGLVAEFGKLIEASIQPSDITATPNGQQLEAHADVTSQAQGTLTTHPKSLSTEDRFIALESQVANLESRHATDVAALTRALREFESTESARHREDWAGIDAVRQLLVAVQAGGLPLAVFAPLWLAIGAVLSSLPLEIAGWIRRLHCRFGVG